MKKVENKLLRGAKQSLREEIKQLSKGSHMASINLRSEHNTRIDVFNGATIQPLWSKGVIGKFDSDEEPQEKNSFFFNVWRRGDLERDLDEKSDVSKQKSDLPTHFWKKNGDKKWKKKRRFN